MTEPREDDRPETDQADTAASTDSAAQAPGGARPEREREAEATIRSISRLEESN